MAVIHQIRLSGNPAFQDTLKEVRIRACVLGVSVGQATEIGSLAVRSATAAEIIEWLEQNPWGDLGARDEAPNPTSFELREEDAARLRLLRGELIGLGRHDLTLRDIAHIAIGILAGRSDEEVRRPSST
ncbi:hypothetical protein [Parvularcula maris]|uniref:Uncharacterized protein n=1 Tax=Parvularcula maris TaxID=2965077 RepID=A0A9X2LA17_9PROT|nr:hypothetical protein [Parvularcula maris]MCQ8185888.1 hypothetical protein [Parvularcula maris]